MNLASHQLMPEGILPENFTMTLEEFLESDVDGYEYVKGELVPMPAPSVEHGLITMNVLRQLDAYVHENQLGIVVCAETGFKVGERVLKPDIAFTAASRIPEDLGKTFPAPPELAVEVMSPSDASRRAVQKAFSYLEAGTRIVWILEPESKTVTVYRSETDIKLLTRDNTITGEDVIEGFSCPVAAFFVLPQTR